MTGTIGKIEKAGDGRLLATVALEGDAGEFVVPYWPELLEQWGPDKLRAHLVYVAAQAYEAEQAAANAAAELDRTHGAMIGTAAAGEPVCVEGELGCTKDHAPEPITEHEQAAGGDATVGGDGKAR